jgi:4-hydroxy-tetrahydrodipicolinate reductase
LPLHARLTSPAGARAQHNVCGRSIYAQGTVDAVAFIAARARERSAKTLFNMVDVLSAGMA